MPCLGRSTVYLWFLIFDIEYYNIFISLVFVLHSYQVCLDIKDDTENRSKIRNTSFSWIVCLNILSLEDGQDKHCSFCLIICLNILSMEDGQDKHCSFCLIICLNILSMEDGQDKHCSFCLIICLNILSMEDGQDKHCSFCLIICLNIFPWKTVRINTVVSVWSFVFYIFFMVYSENIQYRFGLILWLEYVYAWE